MSGPPALLVPVRVQARSKRRGIEGVEGGRLRVRTNAPPADGRANIDVARLLADAFGVPVSRVRLTRGAGSRLKTFEVLRPRLEPDWTSELHFS